jgi:hypothetical protein
MPFAARAQQADRLRRIGVLISGVSESDAIAPLGKMTSSRKSVDPTPAGLLPF